MIKTVIQEVPFNKALRALGDPKQGLKMNGWH